MRGGLFMITSSVINVVDGGGKRICLNIQMKTKKNNKGIFGL